MTAPIRIANASGFLGDRASAAREMVEGGPIDVLTGDYLAELTMAILARQRMRDPATGYARQFLDHLEDVLAQCVGKGIRVVSNAGGLDPAGLATAVSALATRLGIEVRVATVTGDDLMARLDETGAGWPHLTTGELLDRGRLTPITVNAYLGGWGIAAALSKGADIVVTGRVSDASLTVGPAAWHHGWGRDDWDALAGAVVAGHVIECGAQATGGNYSFFEEVPGLAHPGFPIAEVAADGSAVITKHPGTGGLVSVGTVTAQLLYEIGGPGYLNPDVVARLDTVRLDDDGPDRVRISGVRGEPPPPTTKVAMTTLGGFRNSFTFVIPGLDVARKAAVLEEALWDAVGGRRRFADVAVELIRTDHADPATNEAAFAYLKVTVSDPDPAKVGRAFADAAVGLALASYPGFSAMAPPGRESPLVVYWPTLVGQAEVPSVVTLDDEAEVVPATLAADSSAPLDIPDAARADDRFVAGDEPTIAVPIGRLLGARSGDKGGDANLGVWARSDAAYEWMESYLTVEQLQELLVEAETLPITRHVLPNLRALNFVLHGFLGDGVASSTRLDPQAKTLAEYFRAKVVDVPEDLLVV